MCDVVQHTVPYAALVSLACDAGAVARPPMANTKVRTK